MNRLTILQLSLINGVGPATLEKLVNTLPPDADDLARWSLQDFMQAGVSAKYASLLVEGLQDQTLLDAELELLEQSNISWLTSFDAEYPAALRNIHVPPVVLYVWGAIPVDAPSIAFVGSRASSNYGKQVVNALVPELVHAGWTIVSGGAYGIDTAAHEATVKAGGKTVVVLGSGLGQLYPASNKNLFHKVVATGGAVISSFPLMMEALPGNFPARNRIIAGLADGCVVVRAAARSGALITAHYALEQGKRIFAVPGPIDDPLSAGCHALLKQGACLADSATAIFEEFGVVTLTQVEQAEKFRETQQPLPFHPYAADPVFQACQKSSSIDELGDLTGLDPQTLGDRLFELQLAGVVEQDFAGLWKQL